METLHDHCRAERPALPFDSNGPFVNRYVHDSTIVGRSKDCDLEGRSIYIYYVLVVEKLERSVIGWFLDEYMSTCM